MKPFTGPLAGFVSWTSREESVLRKAYGGGGIAAARAALPSRSVSSIIHRARRLGVFRRRLWTEMDEARLRKLWGLELDLSEIAQRLGRTEITTYWRAAKMGLPLGCPPGWEYLNVSAKRVGYDAKTLRRILKASDVAIRLSLAAPKWGARPERVHPRLIVHSASVDAAVAQWLEEEPVGVLARRLGICRETLQRRMERVGMRKQAGWKRQ